MSSELFRSVSTLGATAAVCGLVLSGCMGEPRPGPRAEVSAPVENALLPGPEVTPAELAARPEPRSATEVAAIEAELALIAEQRAGGVSAGEIAALEARARELRRLVAAGEDVPLRR
jgi:hypothetical protein